MLYDHTKVRNVLFLSAFTVIRWWPSSGRPLLVNYPTAIYGTLVCINEPTPFITQLIN